MNIFVFLLTLSKIYYIIGTVDWKQSLSFYSLGASQEVPFALFYLSTPTNKIFYFPNIKNQESFCAQII
jgi:hypothetical protein